MQSIMESNGFSITNVMLRGRFAIATYWSSIQRGVEILQLMMTMMMMMMMTMSMTMTMTVITIIIVQQEGI